MRIFSLIIFALLLFNQVYAQNKPFRGMLEYKITIRDTNMRNMIPESRMFLYTNDTISRMENFSSSLGKQVIIRHMELNKSYMLIETVKGKFAIKSDLNKSDTTQTVSKYEFKKKCFKRKVLGKKAKRVLVSHPEFNEPIEFLYLKEHSNKYLNNFKAIPGLLVKYSVVTPDGVLDYELIHYSEYTPDRDLFGLPDDYQRVTFDEFVDIMTGLKEIEAPEED